MSRSYQVTKDILSDCKNTGKKKAAELLELLKEVVEFVEVNFYFIVTFSCVFVLCWCCILPGFPLSVGNNVLIVAHASSLEACTRQLQGRSPQSTKDFIQVVRKVCSLHIFSDLAWIFSSIHPTSLSIHHYFHLVLSAPLPIPIVFGCAKTWVCAQLQGWKAPECLSER